MNSILKHLVLLTVLVVFVFGCQNPTESKQTEIIEFEHKDDSIQSAIDSLSVLIRENPYADSLFYKRSYYFAFSGDITRAISDMEVAKKLNPEKVEYYLDLADFELNRGESRIAKNILDGAYEKFPENVEVMIRLANIYMAIGQYKEARTKLILASRIEPRNANLYMLSSIIFTEIGEDNRAIEELQKAVMYDPSFYDAHVMLGLINARLGNDMAIDHYENAMRVQPGNPEAVYNLGMFYQEKGMYDKALEIYQKGLDEVDARMQHFLFNQGFIYENYKNDYTQAISFYDSVIQYHPDDYRAFYRKGLCLQAMGKPDEAMVAHDMALKINPKFEEAYDALSALSEARKQNK